MASSTKGYDIQLKLLTLGNSGVGKTCLLLRFSNDTFSPTFITTIGVDFKNRIVNVAGKRVKLQMWDTAGQDQFRSITASFFRNAHGVLLVYDVTDRSSFIGVRSWVDDLNRADPKVSKILVANKCDADEAARTVTHAEGEALARSYGIPFYETSAKRGTGVEAAFEGLAHLVVKRLGIADSGGVAPPKPGSTAAHRDPHAVSLVTEEKPSGGGCAC